MTCQITCRKTRQKRYTNGSPRCSVLSHTLSNLYMRNIPLPTHRDTHILSYANNLTVFSHHPDPEFVATLLQESIYILETWFQTNRLKFSTTKSTLTLITSWNHEYTLQPSLTLNGERIPYTNHPSTLGVI